MTSESHSVIEENNFIQVSECQTLDSLLQNSCETNQSDCVDIGSGSKNVVAGELVHKRSWSEIVDVYVNTLKPKDTLIFIENVKAFSRGTIFMSDFRNFYFEHILKFLNGGEPLKTDFGRDEYTSLYALHSFSAVNSENKEECADTPMIFKVLESMDVLNFVERNPKKLSSNMKVLLQEAKDIYLYFNKIRNNHPKRKRYLIFITCSDLLIDDIDDVVEEMRSMKVRFSLFSPVTFESHMNLCEMLNYNNKGCKDLSCYYQSSKWAVSITHGLSKAFESANLCVNPNKKVKWSSTKEQGESTEYDFNSLIGLGNTSNGSQTSENISNHVSLDMENSLTNTLIGRPIITNDHIEQNFGQSNVNLNNSVTTHQSVVTHSKNQSKFLSSSNNTYYSQGSLNQSQLNKLNQSSYYYNQDQLYSAPNSVSVSSHRSTPSSIPHSQSPQFHMGSSHQNMLQQSNSLPDMMKPNSVESCNEIHNQMTTLNSQKSLPLNQEIDMSQPMQRFPYMNNMNMYNSTNSMINNNNLNSRFVFRPSIYQFNVEPRMGTTKIFDGILTYGDDMRTEFRVFADQSANLSLISMESWDRQCYFYYVNCTESFASSLYGKSITDIDHGCHEKAIIELFVEITMDAQKTICNALVNKPGLTIGIVRPNRQLPPEVHTQVICFVYTKAILKVFIPADPKNLFNEIRNRLNYSGNQTGQIYGTVKRSNVMSNQQVYNIPQAMSVPRQMIPRYNSPVPIMGNQVYRNMSHPPNFITNQQIQPNSSYILHSGQYPAVQNASSNHILSMDMGMQSNQNIYDQNTFQ